MQALTVEQGEISVLMGLSGSGKSTLLRAVNGLNEVTRGEVIVHDGDWSADVVSCPVAELRKIRRECVAMVFQQFALLPWRTVEENVGFGLELAGLPVKRAQASAWLRSSSSSASRNGPTEVRARALRRHAAARRAGARLRDAKRRSF
jgi:ABC-type proline/glycine betaine transport system ATPase subunit